MDEPTQIDQTCDAFDDAWRAGRAPDLGAVVRAAAAATRPRLFRELLAIEREYRQAGRPLDRAEAEARFSGLGGWVGDALDAAFPPPFVVTLHVIGGPHAGARFELGPADCHYVGRQAGLSVSLPIDPRVSRVHFRLYTTDRAVVINDLLSGGGTAVNGTRVDAARLAPGDEVLAGGTRLRVDFPADGVPDPDGTIVEARLRAALGGLPVVPGYTLEKELGRGAMGVVYRAVYQPDGAAVALKVIRSSYVPTRGEVARFRREGEILELLHHPNIVGFRDFGASGAVLYVAMEYVDGANAEWLVRRDGPVPPDQLLGWAGQFLDGLDHLHARGVVHRDVKPANLLVSAAPPGGVVKVSDFGLARLCETSFVSGITAPGAAGGTPNFMPPEQVADFRSVGPAADQYSAAATLYFLLTGRQIYEPAATPDEWFHQILTLDPIPLRSGAAEIPSPFGGVIRRALARDPAGRFPSVRAMRHALLDG